MQMAAEIPVISLLFAQEIKDYVGEETIFFVLFFAALNPTRHSKQIFCSACSCPTNKKTFVTNEKEIKQFLVVQ